MLLEDDLPVLSEAEISEMEETEFFVTVLKVLSPNHFVIREDTLDETQKSTYDDFIRLQRIIQETYTKYDLRPEFPELPAKGEYVIVKQEKDNSWYRARVDALIETSKGAKISAYLVDYGELVTVGKEWVRNMKSEMMKVPFQAVEFFLYGLQPLTLGLDDREFQMRLCVAQQWDTASLQFVQNLISGSSKVKIRVKVVDVMGKQYGELFAFSGGEIVCLNDLLVNDNHAIYSEDAVKNILTFTTLRDQYSKKHFMSSSPDLGARHRVSSESDSGVEPTLERKMLEKQKKRKAVISDLEDSRRRIINAIGQGTSFLPLSDISKKAPLGRGFVPLTSNQSVSDKIIVDNADADRRVLPNLSSQTSESRKSNLNELGDNNLKSLYNCGQQNTGVSRHENTVPKALCVSSSNELLKKMRDLKASKSAQERTVQSHQITSDTSETLSRTKALRTPSPNELLKIKRSLKALKLPLVRSTENSDNPHSSKTSIYSDSESDKQNVKVPVLPTKSTSLQSELIKRLLRSSNTPPKTAVQSLQTFVTPCQVAKPSNQTIKTTAETSTMSQSDFVKKLRAPEAAKSFVQSQQSIADDIPSRTTSPSSDKKSSHSLNKCHKPTANVSQTNTFTQLKPFSTSTPIEELPQKRTVQSQQTTGYRQSTSSSEIRKSEQQAVNMLLKGTGVQTNATTSRPPNELLKRLRALEASKTPQEIADQSQRRVADCVSNKENIPSSNYRSTAVQALDETFTSDSLSVNTTLVNADLSEIGKSSWQSRRNNVAIPDSLVQSKANDVAMPESLLQSRRNDIAMPDSFGQGRRNDFAMPESLLQSKANDAAMPESLLQSKMVMPDSRISRLLALSGKKPAPKSLVRSEPLSEKETRPSKSGTDVCEQTLPKSIVETRKTKPNVNRSKEKSSTKIVSLLDDSKSDNADLDSTLDTSFGSDRYRYKHLMKLK